MKKTIALFMFLVIVAFPVRFILAHEVPATYSTSNADNIGAYYDELWEAERFLYTAEADPREEGDYNGQPQNHIHPAEQLEYRGGDRDDLLGDDDTEEIVRIEPEIKNVNSYGDMLMPGATLANEFIVLEWRATGHIHFTE